MRRFIPILVLILVWSQTVLANSLTVKAYVDIAPSPFPLNNSTINAWVDTVNNQINTGTFVNMEHGALVGSTDSLPLESVVYPFPGYESGNAVAFMFWLPGVTQASQLSPIARIVGNDSAGDFYMSSLDGQAYNFGDLSDPNQGWAPIALNYKSNGAIATILTAWGDYPDDGQKFWRGEFQLPNSSVVGLTSNIVPTPSAVWAGMVLLGTLGAAKLRGRKAKQA